MQLSISSADAHDLIHTPVDGFDFEFCPVRKKLKARYLALHDVSFIDKGVNPLFIGSPGTGKTYLSRALAWRACQANRRVVFVSAARMLNELHGAELHGALERVLRRYVSHQRHRDDRDQPFAQPPHFQEVAHAWQAGRCSTSRTRGGVSPR